MLTSIKLSTPSLGRANKQILKRIDLKVSALPRSTVADRCWAAMQARTCVNTADRCTTLAAQTECVGHVCASVQASCESAASGNALCAFVTASLSLTNLVCVQPVESLKRIPRALVIWTKSIPHLLLKCSSLQHRRQIWANFKSPISVWRLSLAPTNDLIP